MSLPIKNFSVFTLFACILAVLFSFKQQPVSPTRKSFLNATGQEITEYIYDFKFSSADSVLKANYKKHKTESWYQLMSCNYYWWLIISGEENNETLSKFNAAIDDIIKTLGKKDPTELTPEQLYYVANAYAFKTRIDLYKNNYLQAAMHLNSCLGFIKTSLGKEKSYEAFYLTSGLYNYFIDFAHDNYTVARPYLVFMPEGNKKTGFEYLEKCATSKDWVINNEGNYFLCKLYQETEKNYFKAQKYAEVVVNNHPNNIAYVYNLFEVLLNQGKKEQAQKELNRLHYLSKNLPNLTAGQRKYYIDRSKKELKEYFSKKKT